MIYVDTSAFVKLILAEDGSDALAAFLVDRTDLVSSSLLIVEARRAALRRAPRALPRVDVALARFDTIELSAGLIEEASRLPDPLLRSLDAIHLATALLIRDEVDALVTYDERLFDAARTHGLPAEAPA